MTLDIELYRRTIYKPGGRGGSPRCISVIDIKPDQATHTLVLVHGYGGNASQWLYQLRFFGQYVRVIAPEMRGHGLSDDPRELPYTLDGLVSDLEYVLDELEVERPFSIIAHSFGGAISTEYALRHPTDLTGLVLIGVPARFQLRPWLRRLITYLPDPLFSTAAKVYGVALFARQRTLKGLLERVMGPWRGEQRLTELQVPTLVILGHRDTVFLREHYEDVSRSIPQAQRVVISVSAHLVQLERPDAVNRALRRFIGGLLTAGSVAEQTKSAIWPQQASASVAQRRAEMPWLQHYDDDVPEQVPQPRQPLHDLLHNNARSHPKHPALIFFRQKISYRELDRQSNRFARALRALGVRQGDRVAILLPNVPQCVIGFFGTLKAGAVLVLGSPLSNPDEVHYQLRDAGATVLLTLSSYRSEIQKLCYDTHIRHIIYTDVREYLPLRQRLLIRSGTSEQESGDTTEKAPTNEEKAPANGEQAPADGEKPSIAHNPWREHSFQLLLLRHASTPLGGGVTMQDLALIQYTSGTTDTPKGVMLSHGNLMANVSQVRHWMPDARRSRESVLGALPLSHAYGITGAMNVAMSLAGTLILLPTDRIEQLMETISTYHPSIFPGIPAFYLAIANYPRVRRYGVSSIRICVSGSDPLPVEVQEAFEKLTRGHLVEGYGLTEAAPITHSNPLKGERRVGSIGLPLPGTNARIVNAQTGEPLPVGEIGELLVQGPQVMQGYWYMPEESEQVVRDGWLHTGDLARVDEDGFFTIVDRKKDLILSGPYNVYPREVEEVLYEHPKVLEAAVVSTGEKTSPYIKAFVVLKRGEQATAEELLALCRERLDSYEIPGQIEFRSELPKNFIGKVLRRLLVEV